MGWLSRFRRLSSMQWSHQLTIPQALYTGGFRISSYLTEVHHTLQPAHPLPSYSYSENFALDCLCIGFRVASQQDKMKCNHDKFAKFREIAVGDRVLARDHLSGKKWQAGTVIQQTSPVSCQVRLNDGRNWRRHVDDLLQNTPSSAVTHSSSLKVTSDQSTEGVTSPSIESCTPPPEESESVESSSTPSPPTPAPRRSKHATKPPQRLIEEMD